MTWSFLVCLLVIVVIWYHKCAVIIIWDRMLAYASHNCICMTRIHIFGKIIIRMFVSKFVYSFCSYARAVVRSYSGKISRIKTISLSNKVCLGHTSALDHDCDSKLLFTWS